MTVDNQLLLQLPVHTGLPSAHGWRETRPLCSHPVHTYLSWLQVQAGWEPVWDKTCQPRCLVWAGLVKLGIYVGQDLSGWERVGQKMPGSVPDLRQDLSGWVSDVGQDLSGWVCLGQNLAGWVPVWGRTCQDEYLCMAEPLRLGACIGKTC